MRERGVTWLARAAVILTAAVVACSDEGRTTSPDGGGMDGAARPVIEPAVADGACLAGFEAAVRSGPNAGTTLVGLLVFRADPSGVIRDGLLHTIDGLRVEVEGNVDGRDVEMTFTLPDGRRLMGTGAFERDGGTCVGQLAGPLTGPDADDRGDWLGDADGTDTFLLEDDRGGVKYVAAVSPAAHVVMLTDKDTGETMVVAGEVGRSGDGHLLSTPSAVIYADRIARDVSGLVVSDTGNGRILLIPLKPGARTLSEVFGRPWSWSALPA
ncbi:MAG: hypothetical protein IT379_02945 [Deltaproteobacteria bacterium]|nr:hypothetical protein [Deltaproteobacteria bacterium]